jgi:hypothetical protein
MYAEPNNTLFCLTKDLGRIISSERMNASNQKFKKLCSISCKIRKKQSKRFLRVESRALNEKRGKEK